MLTINSKERERYGCYLCDVTITNPVTGHFEKVRAMMDTGTNVSMITPRLQSKLKLEGYGFFEYTTLEGKIVDVPKYDFLVDIKGMDKGHIVTGSTSPQDYEAFDVIIGLDIIIMGNLSINKGDLKFELS